MFIALSVGVSNYSRALFIIICLGDGLLTGSSACPWAECDIKWDSVQSHAMYLEVRDKGLENCFQFRAIVWLSL